MPKKATQKKKTSTKKKTTKKRTTRLPKNSTVEKVLVENFISLQKVMTNLAMKFDNLGAQISKLLELFEISAKTLAEKDIKLNAKPMEDKKLVEKLDSLLDQNKIIARGLSLLHEVPEEMPMPPLQPMAPPMQRPIPPTQPRAPPMQRPMPPTQPRMTPPMNQPMSPPQQMVPSQLPPLKQGANTGGYQKSQKPLRPKSPRPAKKNETVF